MNTYGLLAFAICAMTVLGAGFDSAGERVFTVEVEPSSYPVLDTFGNPTLMGTQVWYRQGSDSSSWDDIRRIEIPIDPVDVAPNNLTAYVYRRGCRVAYY